MQEQSVESGYGGRDWVVVSQCTGKVPLRKFAHKRSSYRANSSFDDCVAAGR